MLADASIFISCAMALSVFNMKKYSENGVTVEPDMEQSTGTIRCGFLGAQIGEADERYIDSHPSAFRCVIRGRSAKAVELINGDA